MREGTDEERHPATPCKPSSSEHANYLCTNAGQMSTTYDVIATRSGDWWTIEVTSGLPGNVLGVSQARRLTEVHQVSRNLIGDLLEVDPAGVDVSVLVQLPPELHEMVELFRDAGIVESVARAEAALARSRAACALLNADLTMRETAEMLGVSHQRIKQLVDRAPDDACMDLLERIRVAVEDAHRDREANPAAAPRVRVGAIGQETTYARRRMAAG